MNNRTLTTAGMLALSIGLSSCSELRSPHYVGTIKSMDKGDIGCSSIWKMADEVYYVRCLNSTSCVAATLEWNKNMGEFTVNSFPIIISELDDHLFLNVNNGDYYTILRLACAFDDAIVLFTIDKDKMAQDVADGEIKAHVDGDHIYMDCSKHEQDEYISRHMNSMFPMDQGRVVQLISEEKENKKKANSKKEATDQHSIKPAADSEG